MKKELKKYKIHNSEYRTQGEGGYIMTIVAIIIVSVSIIAATAVSNSSFLGRFDTQLFELKSVSYEAALGCLEYAKLQLALDIYYSGGEEVDVGNYICRVESVYSSGSDIIVETSANAMNKVTNLRLTIDGATLETIFLEEVDKF